MTNRTTKHTEGRAAHSPAEIDRWRSQMLSHLLLAAAAVGPVAVVAYYLSLTDAPHAPAGGSALLAIAPFIAAWLIVLVVALARGLHHQVRAISLLVVTYSIALVAFASGGLAGSGRLWLLLLTALAHVLLGARQGAVAGLITMLTYAGFVVAISRGWIVPRYAGDLSALAPLVAEGAFFLLVTVATTAILASFSNGMQAALTAAAEANARLTDTNELLRHQTSILQSTAELSRASQSILDPETLLAESADNTLETLSPVGVCRVALFIADQSLRAATLRAASGNGHSVAVQIGQQVTIDGRTGVGRCIGSGEPVITPVGTLGATVDDRSGPAQRAEIALPFRSRGRMLGALSIEAVDATGLAAKEEATLQTVADHIAVAIDNAQLYQAQQRELAERAQAEMTLARQAEELARANAELEQFTHVSSHHLQEPLRMVASYSRLLERRYGDRLDADAREFISFCVQGAVRLQRLINDLTLYSRVTSDGAPFEPVDTVEVIERALTKVRGIIEETGAVVSLGDLPTVHADARQLRQVFQHLVENAAKFRREESPRVHISARRQVDCWLFSVEDCGIGIETQYLERVFHIFERLHSTDDYPGTGIGLALCKKIVERHGGRIWAESEPGKGSTFSFTIPDRTSSRGGASAR